MKVIKASRLGMESWILVTNAGTIVGRFHSEAGARTRALGLVLPSEIKTVK